MWHGIESYGAAWLIGVQAAGLASAVALRCRPGWLTLCCVQRFFYSALALVALAVLLTIETGAATWTTCAATLCIMILLATFDANDRCS